MNSEMALIAAAKRGSVLAFTELVARYRIGLLRFLVTRTASFADAEDALQDTLINAFRYIKSYDARWRFSTWLYRIAINNAAGIRVADTEALGDLCDEESDPLEQCIAASERENLWISARRVLSDEVYTAMWLRYAEDMSVNDIAAVLGRSVSWTKVNLLRARQQLDAAIAGTKNAEVSKAYG
ncbi:MAG: sigma-70 family RNA polymerase sigma factor [Proteobacteria bacterium]|nr:sigma-70 family RNA polymerase sigma factor [Pseudomonadota bacterium]MDA1063729.1 sigma-70 family RNA polymerase sigma factor [Pseudomonadota bacterium]